MGQDDNGKLFSVHTPSIMHGALLHAYSVWAVFGFEGAPLNSKLV
jgi:hypothetical protein